MYHASHLMFFAYLSIAFTVVSIVTVFLFRKNVHATFFESLFINLIIIVRVFNTLCNVCCRQPEEFICS